jgi:hypothetical protein
MDEIESMLNQHRKVVDQLKEEATFYEVEWTTIVLDLNNANSSKRCCDILIAVLDSVRKNKTVPKQCQYCCRGQ